MGSTAGLVGRESELATVQASLARVLVVTITGAAGVGKSRLALAAARSARQQHGSRVDVCELAEVTDPATVGSAVAGSLGYPSLDAAVMGVGEDDRLLLVDNCEHLLDAAADAVERLVEECPGLSVLATSREALDLPGELLLHLDGLSLPTDAESARASAAVELFQIRAAAAGPSTAPGQDIPAVAALCRRLDGLPLAIELAAARTRSLTPREVLDQLDLRPDLLRRRRERGPDRHRSLEAAIGWSHDLLPEATRVFFDRLGVFAGRFTAEAAHGVAAEPGTEMMSTLQMLDQLVGQSLVTVEQREGRSWYGLLNTLRSYARMRLAERGDLEAVRDRWIAAALAIAVETRRQMLRAWPADLFVTLLNAHADLGEALRWCIEHDEQPDRALPLFVPLCGLLKRRDAMPVGELGDRLLTRWPDQASGPWAEAAAATALADVLRGSGKHGVELARRAIDVPGSELAGINGRRALFFHNQKLGRGEDALRWVDEAIELATTHHMDPWHNELLTFRAIALATLGRTDEAITQVGAAYRDAPRLGSPALEAFAASIQACLIALRDPVAGRATLEQAARLCDEVDYPVGAGGSLRALGALSLLSGRYDEAAGLLLRAVETFVGIGYEWDLRATLRWVARLCHQTERVHEAGILWKVSDGMPGDLVDSVLGPPPLDRELGHAAAGVAVRPLAEAVSLARHVLTPAVAGPAGADASVSLFRLEGTVWTLSFAGSTIRLPDAKGLRDLAVLLARPGREVHCTELMGAKVEQSDTGLVLDERARREYEARLIELQQELADAEDDHDRGRAEKAGMEMELLLAQLTAATGLGGRGRRAGSSTDRIRSAVTWRIRAAIKRIDAQHPELGAHLRDAVRTGTWCAYQPASAPVWELGRRV